MPVLAPPKRLVLRSLTLNTVIGVYDWERVAARPLIFDFRLESTQRIAINREQMKACLRHWVAECRYQLLEALAEHIAQKLIREFACRRVCIAIEKPGALGKVARVGIRITRHAEAAATLMPCWDAPSRPVSPSARSPAP